MSNLTIEQQVAELTPEQKNNLGKIYKKYVISLISVILIGVVLIAGIFVYASVNEAKAKEKHDKVQDVIDASEENGYYGVNLFDESEELLDEYYDMKELKPLSLVIGAGTALIGLLIVYFVFKFKYPYFSEKKYSYLKKAEKAKQ